MTPHDDKFTLDRLWDEVPVGTPPIDALVRGGKKMRRRARLRVVGCAAALTLAVVAGSAVAADTVFDGASPRPDGEVPAGVDPPSAPAGKRLVGMGRVAVAVPAQWGTNELDLCGSPDVGTVWFGEVNAPNHCLANLHRGASVQFTTLDTEAGQAAVDAARTSTGDGLTFRGAFVCPPNADCTFSPDAAPQYVVVPSHDVAITLFGPERSQDLLDAVAASVQILPEGYTTVPYVDGNDLAAWKTAIAGSGLVPDGALPECADVRTPQPGVLTNALCDTHPRVRPDPAAGTVVAVGATVTLFPPSPTAVSLPCDEGEQTMVMWDLAGPGRPTPSQAVAPHAGALTLVEQESAGETTVFGLRADGSVFRAFQVTKHDDGWWPDGYRECAG